MTESMSELLGRLKELDPETWRDFKVICNMTAFDDSPLDDPDIDTPVFGWSLQGVIQETCKAKKWHHDVCYNEETEKYVSLVVPADNETWLDSVEADTAAESLLATYIQALEAEAAR